MILITGSTGQLGKALREFFPDALYTTRKELDLLGGDITERVKELNPEYIINCAAIVGKVDIAEEFPAETVKVNALAVHDMLKGMKDPSKFVQISSDYAESENMYGLSKRMSEAMVIRHGGLVIRTSWLFGEGNNWVNWTIRNYNKPLTIVDDQWARPTYARDLARYINTSLGQHGMREVQNSGAPTTWYKYARKICRIKGLDCKFTPITTEKYRQLHPEVAPRPLHSVMPNMAEMPNWEDSLKEYIDAYC